MTSIVRAAQWASSIASEALRARVGQAGATSQTVQPTVHSNSTSIEDVAASASVIYRQRQNEVPDNLTYSYLAEVKNYKAPVLPDFEKINEIQQAADIGLQSLGNVWKDFKQTLKTAAPDLASLDFGFTLNADGSLLVTPGKSVISTDQKQRLNEILNQSEKLKIGAQEFSKNAFAYAKAHNDFSLGLAKFDENNFKEIIDIGEAIEFYTSSRENKHQHSWVMQLNLNVKTDLTRQKEFNTPTNVENLKILRNDAPKF
jgi:hypothetical protein